MKNKKLKFSFILLLIISVIVVGGCSSGVTNLTDNNNIEDQVTNNGELPVEDAKLAEHAPRQIIVKANSDKNLKNKLEEMNAHIESEIEEMNIKKIILPEDKSIVESIKKFREVEGVEYANPNYKRETMGTFTGDTPDDPKYSDLWGLDAINAPEAWKTTTGSSDVVIAVIDTGIQGDHPDLKNKVLDGFNVYEENSDTNAEYSHGTHVAGIAAGLGNNEKGIAGVAWNSPILPIRVFQPGQDAWSFEIAEGINWLTEWAEENDSKEIVANMSLGGPAVCKAEKEAIDRAIDQGIVFSVSMGNATHQTVSYPAAYNGVIAVGATDGNDEKADFSTEGDWISVAAPGYEILSSVPEDEWGLMSGTSMAAPYVTGAAALILDENPDYTPAEVKSVLEKTAQDLGKTGFDNKFGHGLIDVTAALNGTPDESAKFTVKVISERDIDGDGTLEQVDVPGAEVALKNSNGFVVDEVTDTSGQAVFNMIKADEYDVEISYNKGQNPPYQYGSKIIKNVNISTGNNSLEEFIEIGFVSQINITSTINGNEYTFNDNEVKNDVLDSDNHLVFEDIETPSINPLISLNSGDYTLRVSDYKGDKENKGGYRFDFEETTTFNITKNEETQISVSDQIPVGQFRVEFSFEDEEGNTISADDIEVTLLDPDGNEIFKDETYGNPVVSTEVSPSQDDYTLKVTASKGVGGVESDLVGYKEIAVNVNDGEVTQKTVTMTLK